MKSLSATSLLHTTTGRALLFCTALAVLFALVAALVASNNPALAVVCIALALISIVGLLLLLYYRLVIQLGLHIVEDNRTTFQQTAALMQLVNLIHPRLPLPPLRIGAASPDLLLLLCEAVLTKRPQTLVECGAGVSTLVQGYLLEKLGHGKLYSLEHDAFWAKRVDSWVTEHGLNDFVTIVYAPLTEQLVDGKKVDWYDAQQIQALINDLRPVDFLFVDGPPGDTADTRWPALTHLRSALAADAEIIMDDTGRANEELAAKAWAKQLDYELEFINNEKGAGWLHPRR